MGCTLYILIFFTCRSIFSKLLIIRQKEEAMLKENNNFYGNLIIMSLVLVASCRKLYLIPQEEVAVKDG